MLEFSGFYILFNLQFSRNFFVVARKQLWYSIISRFVCQQLFYFIFCRCFCSQQQLLYLIISSCICQQLFQLFSKLFPLFSQWNYNIAFYRLNVKGICSIFSTIFNWDLLSNQNHYICAFYKHIPIYSGWNRNTGRSINRLFTLELFKLKILLV